MKYILELLSQNRQAKILALVITIVIWIVVVSKSKETRTVEVKTKILLPKNKMLVNSPEKSIRVVAKGNKFAFARISDESRTLVVDLRKQESDRAMLYFDSRKFLFSNYLEIEQISPKEIIYSMSKRITKKVKVNPYLDGQPLNGWRVKGVTIDPEYIEVTGPESELAAIDSVVTDRVVLNGLKTGITSKLSVLFRSPHISSISVKDVLIKVDIKRDVRSIVFKNIPVALENGGFADFYPSSISVKLKGPVEKLNQLHSTGIVAYVENRKKKRYTVNRYFLKSLPKDVEPVEFEKVTKIIITKRKL